MNETTTISGTTSTAILSGYSGTYGNGLATPLNGNINSICSNGSNYNSISTAITNSNNMNKQVKVAVFTVERNEDNKVTSSTLYGEFWVEVKNGSSLDLAVAKQLSKDFDPANTIIKELYSFTF